MKHLKIWLAATSFIMAGSAIADGVVFTEHFVSNPAAKRAYVARDYAGVSQSFPCSDLTLRSTHDMEDSFSDNKIESDSAELVKRAGSQATCYKRTYTMARSGNVYSTDNVVLTWNEFSNVYDKAAPAMKEINISKG